MGLKGKDVLSAAQFTREQIEQLFAGADDFAGRLEKGEHLRVLDGKLLATVFYEPSTRTRLSFETAMQRLGGGVLSVAEARTASSVAKGETLPDTIRTIANYADAIVLRHPDLGAAQVAANAAAIPILNAGDGAGEHPTQALLDLYTIRSEKKTIDGLRIALVGDLKNGRTVHALVEILSLYGAKMYFVSPGLLQMPEEITSSLRSKGIEIVETEDLAYAASQTDLLYLTRIQKERFSDLAEYERVKGSYVVDAKFLAALKKDITLLHPLPRVDEIHPEVDAYPGAAYFRQVRNGVFIRMALLAMIFGKR
jgi:aspartate carbamoyltransferase